MYDIHCHLIYGVDDGSDSIEESVEMARLAIESGTDAIVATPHCNVPESYENFVSEDLISRFANIKKALKESGVPLKLYPGQEIFFGNRTLELLKQDKLMTMNNSRYVLVEFDFYEYSSSVYRKLSKMTAEGYIPIVAHPERYGFVSEEEDAAIRMKGMGCLLQINKGSLAGGFGRGARENALNMLEDRIVDFVASDAHSPYMRTTVMSDAHEMISEYFSPDYADMIFEENPYLAIHDKPVNVY